MTDIRTPNRWAALTRELDNPRSPVRVFLDERLTPGLKEVQGRYRKAAPDTLLLPPGDAHPGTVGTAADWLLKFLIHPTPNLHIPQHGARLLSTITAGPLDPTTTVLPAFETIAEDLGIPAQALSAEVTTFTYPAAGSSAEPDLLARACWALALLTNAYRSDPLRVLAGPLNRFRGETLSRDDLLSLAPDNAINQLTGFRKMFEDILKPELAKRPGTWALGPTFTGSAAIGGADADLIAAGLLLELKTTQPKPSLANVELYQLIGYTLLDFEDTFELEAVGIFNARYGYLATWDLMDLLEELAGFPVSLPALREQFRQLLLVGPGA